MGSTMHPYGASQFLKQHQSNLLQAPTTQHDSERNISNYDDINGSFIDEMAMAEAGQTIIDAPMYENAEEKLRQLAI